MKSYCKLLMASVALAAVSALSAANAETVQTTTVVTQTELPNMEKTDFMAFDLNNDGILSMKEVGEKLFFIFDRDGNQVIDNIEFDQKRVMTIIPMEKQVFTFVDENDDGTPNEATFTYETFIERSGLIRFDQNMNGLSAAEFIQDSFLQLDNNNSKVVELDEWKRAYTHMARKETERFN